MSENRPAQWAAKGLQMLPGLAPRPQQHICNKDGGKEHVVSDSPATFVFIKDCKGTEVLVEGKVGKIVVENGDSLKLIIENPVVGGTVELVRCSQVHVELKKDAEVPVLQVDNSSNINMHILRKSQLQSIYYIRTTELRLFLENQTTPENPDEGHALEFRLDADSDVPDCQRVGHWESISNSANFVTENVVRDGIYPSTAQMKRAADEREERAMNNMVSMLMQGVRIEKPKVGGSGARPVSNAQGAINAVRDAVTAPTSAAAQSGSKPSSDTSKSSGSASNMTDEDFLKQD